MFKHGIIFLIVFTLTSCTKINTYNNHIVKIDSYDLAQKKSTCTNNFIPHKIPHRTSSDKKKLIYYVSNGAGVSLADLNNDNLIDIVLAGLDQKPSVLLNMGNFKFDKYELDSYGTRGVYSVDIDGDGILEIVFTHAGNHPSLWKRNTHSSDIQFERVPNKKFIGRFNPYSLAWANLDEDNDLDMVGASYNAELIARGLGTPVGGGVFLYKNKNGFFKAYHLASHSQALGLLIFDLDGDGLKDIFVGNDFGTPDMVLSKKFGYWSEINIFKTTTANTMGFAIGDVDNDGIYEIIATDMKPFKENPIWIPPLTGTGSMQSDDGIQFLSNTLYFKVDDNNYNYIDLGKERGVDATGWSWSVQFGDLDNDGYLDLYIVNGMHNEDLFDHLPGNELIEKNQVFKNNGTGHFISKDEWDLDSSKSGRGMSIADLDNDGDLDIVINNYDDYSYIYENNICKGDSIEISLHWNGSKNSKAIGSELQLVTKNQKYYRLMEVNSGYISSIPARVHFGVGDIDKEDILYLRIIWPDGKVSKIDSLSKNKYFKIYRQETLQSVN